MYRRFTLGTKVMNVKKKKKNKHFIFNQTFLRYFGFYDFYESLDLSTDIFIRRSAKIVHANHTTRACHVPLNFLNFRCVKINPPCRLPRI
jgi:hypothetical protein